MAVTTAGATDDDDSASSFLPYCKLAAGQAGNKAYLAGRCVGLVKGVADALALVKQVDVDRSVTQLCVDRPRNAGASQAVEVVVKYGEAHPEQMRAPFTVVAALALTEAWACAR
jgi:isopentenyl diphosphate isomerase/L-lactate dehydrogenase-like FMN-dependent dehydrogenase